MTNVAQEIKKREHAIKMYGFDVCGSDAPSNVDKMRELREEIKNLKIYGKPKPSFWDKVFNGKD